MALHEALQRAWWQPRVGVLACLLWPWSLVYRLLRWAVQAPWRWGWRQPWRAPVPVLVVGNLVKDGLGGDSNTVILLDDQGRHPLGPAPKIVIARGIVARIGQMLVGNGGQ